MENMGWRGRGFGMWPGRGPFSYLPPWQRPGWLFGRGACWWLFNPWYSTAPLPIQMTKEEEQRMLKNEIALLEKEIERIRNRLKELEGK